MSQCRFLSLSTLILGSIKFYILRIWTTEQGCLQNTSFSITIFVSFVFWSTSLILLLKFSLQYKTWRIWEWLSPEGEAIRAGVCADIKHISEQHVASENTWRIEGIASGKNKNKRFLQMHLLTSIMTLAPYSSELCEINLYITSTKFNLLHFY